MLVKNIYVRLGSNILVALISFVTFMFILQTFGKEVVGNIVYCYSLAGVLSLFADLGFSTAYTKFLASDENSRDINTYLILKLFLIAIYIVMFLVIYFFKFRNNGVDSKLLLILFSAIVLNLVSQIFICTFTGRRDFTFLSKLEIGSSIFLCAYSAIICFVFRNKYLIAANRLVLPLVMIIGGIFYFRRHKLLKLCVPEWRDIKKYLDYSMPIAFSSIAGSFIVHIDKILLGRFIGMNELGLYEIASRCYMAVDKLVKPVTSTLFTEIVHRVTNIPTFFHKKFRDIVQILNFFSGIMVLMLVFLSTPVISIVFGVENIRSALILKFFALSILARLLWRPYNHVIYAIEKHRLILYMEPLSLLIRIMCYYFLIPLKIGDFYFGAIALPLTEFVLWFFPAGFLRVWILKKEYGNIHILETILKVWLPVAAFIIIGYFLSYSIFVLAIALISFIIIEYYFKLLTKARLNYLFEPLKSAYSKL